MTGARQVSDARQARRRQRNAALRMAGAALIAAIAVLIAALSLEQGAPPADAARRMPDGAADSVPAPSSAPGPAMSAGTGMAAEEAPPALPHAEPASESASAPAQAPAPMSAPVPPATDALPVVPEGGAMAPADGYRIQLGVFGEPANALALQRELAARGLPAGIQSRVVLGPFADRDAARKAQSALRAEGFEAGMLLPPAKKKP